jgi:hypothetical protein
MTEPATATPPDEIYRVARNSGLLTFSTISPLDASLPTAGNRFDVPGGGVLYAASSPEACYVETLARFRPTPRIRELVRDEPGFMVTGGVPQDWRLQRALARIRVEEPLPFLDVEDPATHEFLNQQLASELVALGYNSPLDLATICNQDRRLSRAIADYAYTAVEANGLPTYSGIRYMSRIGSGWECWAIFEGTDVALVDQRPIELHDPDLQRVAKMWELTIF